jgi:Type II secretion system protein C
MAPAKTPSEGKNWLPLLLALMAALAGLVLWDRQSGDGAQKGASPTAVVRAADKSPRAQAAARTEQGINPLANLSLDKLHDTVRRPLFETSRRPIEAPAPLLPPPQAEPVAPSPPFVDQNALSLLGVVASEGRAIALIKRNQTGQNVRVEVGDAVDGWTIVSIEPQRVMIRQGDTQIALRLFRKKSSP